MKKRVILICSIALGIIMIFGIFSILNNDNVSKNKNNDFSEDKNNVIENDSSNNTLTEDENINEIESNNIVINEFPQQSDVESYHLSGLLSNDNNEWLFNEKDNFQNVKLYNKGYNFTVSCDAYYENLLKCGVVKINFDNYISDVYYGIPIMGCSDGTFIIFTEKYMIEQKIDGCGSGGKIRVLNKEGMEVFAEEHSVYMYSSNNLSNTVKMAVVENKLHFVSYDKNSIEKKQLYYNIFDLNTLEKKQIEVFNGIPAGQIIY